MTISDSKKIFVFILIKFIILCKVTKCNGCEQWHRVQLATDDWYGDLNVITDLSFNDVGLNLLFGEHTDQRTNGTINVENNLMDIKLLAQYDDYGSPILKGIVINGVDICAISESVVKVKPPIQPQTTSTTEATVLTSNYEINQPYTRPPPSAVQPNQEINLPPYTIPDECGITIPEVVPYIHYGTKTTVSDFPWHATIFDMPYYTYRCGGSLISSNLVVTAAHCVTISQTSYPLSYFSLLVVLGKDQLQSTSIVEQKSAIAEIHVHTNFDPNNFNEDIAVIKLQTRMMYTNFVRPVCIWPYNNDRLDSVVDKYGLIPGFGYNEHWHLPDQLISVKMPVIPYVTCLSANRDFYARVLSETNYCAGSRNGSSVCNGDSGGGMVFKINSLYYLRGIVSIGPANENDRTRCNTKFFIVFTDVAKYANWLGQF